jgi:hypothetical protein
MLIAKESVFIRLGLQNKCTRYWPDEKESVKDMEIYKGVLRLKRLSENSTTDYKLREFELTRESSDPVG